jgi:integrative and conjugative element protein (TIGR02256 family)
LNDEDHEAGGVLLGRHIVDSDDIVIDKVTTPQPGDRSSRFRFIRARRRHQKLIDAAWCESNGTVTYLGEWHTHPERVPHPSLVDRVGWVKKLLFDDFADALFFVIVGTEGVGVWEGRHRHPAQTQLREARAHEDHE